MLPAIELLRKLVHRLQSPVRPVCRPKDGEIERFLLNHEGNIQRQQENAATRAADVDCRPVAFRRNFSLFRNQESVNHGEGIVAKLCFVSGYRFSDTTSSATRGSPFRG